MKKITLLLSLLVVGLSAFAAPRGLQDLNLPAYEKPIIFMEGGVEFAVYPDGQFDFFFNSRRGGFSIEVVNPGVNISFNSGYNYDPFVQYDDFGAVIQIENVPVHYDYYGRIIRAGKVRITYNHLGKVARIGNLSLYYNPYNQLTHYNGFINKHNRVLAARPWHHFYRPPYPQNAVVYHQPYRTFYQPIRVTYEYHTKYYMNNYNQGYVKRYYRPGDNGVVYHRGRRTESAVATTRNNYNKQSLDATVDGRTRSALPLRSDRTEKSLTRAEIRDSQNRGTEAVRKSNSPLVPRTSSPRNQQTRTENIQQETRGVTPSVQRSSSGSSIEKAAPIERSSRSISSAPSSRSSRGRG